eukprot:13572919-Alexandrium_andersonii.AAC.1
MPPCSGRARSLLAWPGPRAPCTMACIGRSGCGTRPTCAFVGAGVPCLPLRPSQCLGTAAPWLTLARPR